MVADGENMLDKDCFVAMNRFSVLEGSFDAFEQRFFQSLTKTRQ